MQGSRLLTIDDIKQAIQKLLVRVGAMSILSASYSRKKAADSAAKT
jgi:hypothetical protein